MKVNKKTVGVIACILVLVCAVAVGLIFRHSKSVMNDPVDTEEVTSTTVSDPEPVSTPVEKTFPVFFEPFDGYEKVSPEEMDRRFKKNIARFDPYIRKCLTEVYDGLVKNIGRMKYYMTLCGFPDSVSYIYEQYVKPLETVGFIRHVKNGDPDFYDLRNKYDTSCFVPNENGIYVLQESYMDDYEMHLVLAEEVVHAGQDVHERFDGYGDYLILGEGEANTIAAMQMPMINTENLTFFFDDYDYDHICELHGISHQQNTMATRYYVYLMVLVGYEGVERWLNSGDSAVLENAISERFGIDGTKFYDDLYESIMRCAYDEYFEEPSKMFETENAFLDCFRQIIRNVRTEKEAKYVFELYRYLNIQFKSEYMDYTGIEGDAPGIDITNQFIDRSEVEDDLYAMVNKYFVQYLRDLKSQSRLTFNAYINPGIEKKPDGIPTSMDRKDVVYDRMTSTIKIMVEGEDPIVFPVEKTSCESLTAGYPANLRIGKAKFVRAAQAAGFLVW